MSFVSVQNLRMSSLVLSAPPETVAKLAQQIGADQMGTLMRYAASEQTRHYTSLWIDAQFPLALLLLGCLALATQRKIMPLALCGIMLVILLFEFRISQELIYQGRQVDFPPGSNAVGPMTRFWALQQVYFGAEIVKLLCGGVLASYLFVFRTSRRPKESRASDSALRMRTAR